VKVVLFYGGMGTRLQGYSGDVLKPLAEVGYRPILWHLLKYDAHFGHREFILCLGHRGQAIKNFFLNYNECETNDFVLYVPSNSAEHDGVRFVARCRLR
jgi:glucose-1-phosphate cytidylyltransferase